MGVPIEAILNRKGRDVVTVRPDATITDAADVLAAHNIGALVVSSDGETLEGILSERDIVRRLAQAGAPSLDLPVSDVMTQAVSTAHGDETADELMQTMTRQRHRHIPVVKGGKLAGIVSIGDVVKSRMDELEIEAEALKDYVTGSSY